MTSPTLAQRHHAGSRHLAAMLNYWLVTSTLSHQQFAAAMDWGLGERSPFHGGVLSRLRNGHQLRGAGFHHLDAFACGNRAIWTWQTKGQEAALQEYGLLSSWKLKAEWLDKALWLPQVEDPQQPLNLADLVMVVSGQLELPYVASLSRGMEKTQLQQMSMQLTDLLYAITRERGWGLTAAIAQMQAAYPSRDTGRLQRLRRLIVGEEYLNPDELELELPALAEMIREVRELEQFTPGDLVSALLTGTDSPSDP